VNGKLVGSFIVIVALGFGAVVYYMQEYGYYQTVSADTEAASLTLTPIEGDQPETLPTEGFEGVDADSSPLRFRSCFRVDVSLATLTETYKVYPEATPLIGPNWFSCFDAKRIGADLETGRAVAFLSEKDIRPGVDRVVAIYPDGRGYAWNQLNGETDAKPSVE
jgi:hypothetical protein